MRGFRGSVMAGIVALIGVGGPVPGRAAPARPAAPAPTPRTAGEDAGTAGARTEAIQLLRQGNRELDRGNYRGALRLFQRAYARFQSPKLHFNMAQAWHELNRPLKALQHYELFLKGFRKADSPELYGIAFRRAFKLRGEIASVRLEINVIGAQITVDGRRVGRSPLQRPLRFLPGPHAVVVSKAGYDKQVLQRKLAPGTTVLRIKLLTEAQAMARRKEVQRIQAERRRAEVRLRRAQRALYERQRRRLFRFRVAGWSVVATGVAVLAASVGAGIVNLVKNEEIKDQPLGTDWVDVERDHRTARTTQVLFWTGMSLGAVVVSAGVVMLYWQRRMARKLEAPAPARPTPTGPQETVRVTPWAGPRGAGASLTLTF